MTKGYQFGLYWFPLIGYLSLIFYLSHSPSPTGGQELLFGDKFWHFIEYFPMPLLFFRVIENCFGEKSRRRYFVIGCLLSFLFAVSDEWHQSFIPGREASFGDLLADSAGILAGAFLLQNFRVKI